ncbi:MAG: TetR/AcrR family transcriptional regulator [Bacteroidia bacterium]
MKKENKRKELLKTASTVFSKYGLEKTTLEDISKMANLNKASLYYYFKNKEEIYAEVVMDEATILISELQGKIEKFKNHESKIINYILERLSCYEKALNLHNISFDARKQMNGLFQSLYRKIAKKEIEFLSSLIDDGIKSKEFSSVNSKLFAEVIITTSDAIRREELLKQTTENPAGKFHNSVIKTKLKFAITLFVNSIKK